ncbi:hypothetical protein FFK22_024475 [Mycobacterium sp. KBS0706]|uniref:hypothetical protein n=1 Tax=Mycobacterium sp. KBS0706 TaxID=2578109 RepID=UPI00110FB1D9|nr:hypothetical protein [Mycobacterium sp. KBS0706]TSD85981.1 hypothetical protein FFK22_024475 [Mycobacterium sp. KBS0706]
MNAQNWPSLCFALSVLLVALPWSAQGGAVLRDGGAPQFREQGILSAQAGMARPPDDEAVLAQEFRGAVDDGSNAALIRFIARHPETALADEAWRRLQQRPAPDEHPLANDPDAAVYAAFDTARRTGTAEAWRDFARTYATHPLAAEATRLASQ